MRTWIDIDLDALKANYRTACGLTETAVTCVLKANAYGHGAIRVAQALQQEGCESFAVSCGREALELRLAGVTGEILVMSPAEEDELPALCAAGVTLTACSIRDLEAADCTADRLNGTAELHLKFDTGFHRLGFDAERETVRGICLCLRELRHIRVCGIYSHLGLVSRQRDERQYARLTAVGAWFREFGFPVDEMHLCDSIGLVRYPEWHMSRCRVGAMLFGVRPSGSDGIPFSCLETLALRARVTRVHTAEAGAVIGYDETVTERPVRVATIAAGYGDGYPRRLSNGRGQVIIRGHRAPVIGLVCMDQLMADITGIPDCEEGDTATLLGGGISYAEMADWAGTNRNECLTILSRRPVRVYHEGRRTVTVLDSMLNSREDY